jgi:hypothetical protein
MHINIHTAALANEEVSISDSAAQAIRMGFNPSAIKDVDRLKAIAAAFISECERIKATPGNYAGRELSVAITEMQTASMWAVLGATKGL